MTDKKKPPKNEKLDRRKLRRHCVVLDEDSREILESARAELKAKGNFRINYSQIIRYCLNRVSTQGNWDGLEFIF